MAKVVTQFQSVQADDISGRDGGSLTIGAATTGALTAASVSSTGTVTLNNAAALLTDGNGDILLATGTTVPTDTTTGYAKGCLFIDTDVGTGTTGLYCNKGTNTSCVFTAVTQA